MSVSSSLKKYKDAVIDFTSGSLGAVASVYVGQPLDTVKVKMQTFPQLYTGMVDCFRRTLAQEGVYRGLYAGTAPALAANVAENSVLFAGYGVCQKAICSITDIQNTNDLSLLGNASAGSLAAILSSFTLCPTELIKCRLQALNEIAAAKRCDDAAKGLVESAQAASTSQKKKIGPWKLMTQILYEEGTPGLFRGLTSTIAREMPGYFFFFGGYEASRGWLAEEGQKKDEISFWKTMLSGGIGGFTFWIVIFPADVIKSRIQVTGSKESLVKVFLHILKKEGLAALYNGLKPTLVRTVPATAALFLVYENTKKLFLRLYDDYL